ncbi:MAG: hypothetical protein MUC59_08645, partial [Saprospiraceae bacterium]|nr:hypothetical protein [Saprospiraceae bacterium]
MIARLTAPRFFFNLTSATLLLSAFLSVAKAQCPGLGSITFNVVAGPVPTLDFPTSICSGQSATIAVNEIFESYLWSTGSTASSITVSQSGTFTVTVTNSGGCEGTASATVAVNPNPLPTITGPTTICQNNPVVLSAAGSFASWAWSTGESTPDITISTAGTYAVTVTDANGCTGTDDVVVTASSSSTPPEITSQPFICGIVTLNAGPGYASYNWSNGGNAQTINVQTPGNYTVTVTDAAGCTGTDAINVDIPPPIPVQITGPTSICTGGTAILSASPGYLAYFWSNGSNAPAITITQPGTYSVTATDINNCNTAVGINIIADGSLTPPTILGSTTICSGGSTVLSLADNYPSILWSSGQTTQQITVTNTGTYSVTVTDVSGCTASSSVTVTQGGPLNFPFSALPSGCGQFILEVGASYPSILWSTGSTAQSIIVTQSGPYSVTVTDAGGCTGSIPLTIIIPPSSVVQISGGQSICSGGTTNLTASPGFLAYSWSNGVNTASNAINQPGTYTVTATDATGCTSTATTTIGAVPSPTPELSQPAPICAGETATISVTNPIFQNYNWSNGGTGTSITVSSSGTYIVTVTDATGCTGTAAAGLTVSPSPFVTASQLPFQCNGLAELSATPGFPTYAWSNGESTPNITVNQPGSYTVTVTGASGCTSTANVVANVPTAPQVSITGDPDICEGTNAILSATPGFASYFWSTGQSGPNISVNATGTYFVTVTNGFSCTATNSFNVTAQPSPVPQITGPTQICAGGTAVFTATGGPFASYAWSNGGQTPTISTAAPGNYVLTVTSANGCTGTASVDLTVGNSLNIALTELPYQCNGEITLDAGAGFQSYAWSNGSSAQLVTVTSNGNFTVTVTDATGCSGSATASVSIPAQPQASISGPAQICEGESAELIATAGFANYLWSNGQQNSSIFATTADTYSVTVSDFDGCQATASFVLDENTSPQPIISGISTICQNSSTLLSAAGNFQTWAWSTGQTTPEITASAAGDYTVTVTNASGCTGTDMFLVIVGGTNLQPEITSEPLKCRVVTLDAGAGYSSYLWSNGDDTPTIDVDQDGEYSVTVTDITGCTGADTFNVILPLPTFVDLTVSAPLCPGGTITLTASAGFDAYIWSNGTTGVPSITVTQPGDYSVTAIDVNKCNSADGVLIIEDFLPPPQIQGSTTFCSGSSTLLSLSQNYLNILWSTGETTQQITASTAGTYAVTVSDAGGCTGTASITVTTSSSLSPQVSSQQLACSLFSLDAGPGYASYAWSDGSSSQTVLVSQNGLYTVTVSDAGGCTGTASVTVTLPTPIQVAITGEPTICSGNAATLTATVGFLAYFWSDGATTQQTAVTQAGQYSVTATDVNGCNTVAAFTVTAGSLPPPQIQGSTTFCSGSSTLLSLSQGYPNILWSTGETTQQITVSTAGTYAVTVSDAGGCTGTASVTVTTGSSLSPQIIAQPYDCDGQLTLDAGAGFQTYTWSNGGASQTLVVSQNGNYAVTVSDAGGCTGTAVFNASIPAQQQVAITGGSSFCTGGSSVLTASAGFQDYLWSNGTAAAETTVTLPGNYTVTATDANGCTSVATVTASVGSLTPPQIQGSTTFCTGSSTLLSLSQGYPNILWSTGENSQQITASTAGNYAVTVSDAGGCTGTASVTVTTGSSLSPQITTLPVTCGLVNLDAGPGFASYAWSVGSSSQTLLVSQNGNYTVTVSDAGSCTGTASVTVTLPTPIQVAITGEPTICTGNAATLTATAGFVGYFWSNGATAQQTTITQPGQYSVTATDVNGCNSVAAFTVVGDFILPPQILGSSIICNGNPTTLGLSASYDNYLWSNGSTNSFITVATPGLVSVTVTYTNGCSGETSIDITAGSNLDPQVVQVSNNCSGLVGLGVGNAYETYL